MYVWVLSESMTGGPEYSITGVFISQESALEFAGGSIHPDAGQNSFGGWKHPDGTHAWSELDENTLITETMLIERKEVIEDRRDTPQNAWEKLTTSEKLEAWADERKPWDKEGDTKATNLLKQAARELREHERNRGA